MVSPTQLCWRYHSLPQRQWHECPDSNLGGNVWQQWQACGFDELTQHQFSQWLVTYFRQLPSQWPDVDLSSVRSCGIHLRTVSLEMLTISFTKIKVKCFLKIYITDISLACFYLLFTVNHEWISSCCKILFQCDYIFSHFLKFFLLLLTVLIPAMMIILWFYSNNMCVCHCLDLPHLKSNICVSEGATCIYGLVQERRDSSALAMHRSYVFLARTHQYHMLGLLQYMGPMKIIYI